MPQPPGAVELVLAGDAAENNAEGRSTDYRRGRGCARRSPKPAADAAESPSRRSSQLSLPEATAAEDVLRSTPRSLTSQIDLNRHVPRPKLQLINALLLQYDYKNSKALLFNRRYL